MKRNIVVCCEEMFDELIARRIMVRRQWAKTWMLLTLRTDGVYLKLCPYCGKPLPFECDE